ncbi:MAG: protein kinase domain-containing protein [Pyrinomonadaceae bacterium]
MRELALNNCRIDRRYDTRELLGRGSYAEIYLARDILASPQSPHGLVVLKALNVFLQDDTDADLERTLVENFQNEAVALDRVRHPNIISRLGHGTSRDLNSTVFHYLVIEYMPGGDLQMRVRRRKLAPQEAMNLIEQVCAGLAHAHERGVIHRDIKPQNLLLSADHSTVKIADFGVARGRGVDSPITRVGTNIYAPPEHSPLNIGVDVGASQLTPAADIYSLAKTVYSLMTGETPRAFANEPIGSLPESVSGEDWANELLTVLARATNKEPSLRPQTVDEFWNDLAAVRSIIAEGEFMTVLKAAVAPQPHVARGYSPIAPTQPSFQGVRVQQPVYTRPAYTPPTQGVTAPSVGSLNVSKSYAAPQNLPNQPPISPYIDRKMSAVNTTTAVKPKKRRTFRRLATFAVFSVIFVGALYGTASYMRGKGIIPNITSPFAQTKTAVANTDIYLRPAPNTDNDPIGLVTKNSKVRIVNSRDNWYQVDVVEQGRVRPNATNATRGWLNGKYIDLAQN